MAPYQTTYDQYAAAALPGMKADLRDDTVETFAAEGDIPFGFGVVVGTDTEVQVKVPSATGQVCRGIALRTAAAGEQPLTDGTSVGYHDKTPVNVLRVGSAWVPVVDAVVMDAAARLIKAGDDKGKWTDNAGNADSEAVPGAFFKSATSGAGLAKVVLNLPQAAAAQP